MKRVNIVGVPEHFNLPWHMGLEEGVFAQAGIDLIWTDVPEGTGRMCKMLNEKEADLAVILTEGITKSIIEGNPVKIIQEYIATPLLWGIHVAQASEYESVASLEGGTAAISRFGSGSHLMSFLLAEQQKWSTDNHTFEVVHTIEGAVDALQNKKADYFLWERFTTKPLVDRGIFRRLGDCPTPWPCFVIAARTEFIEKEPAAVQLVLENINRISSEFKHIPSIDRTIANRYDQKLEDVQEWLTLTKWSQSKIKTQVIENVINTLYNLKLIEKRCKAHDILTIL